VAQVHIQVENDFDEDYLMYASYVLLSDVWVFQKGTYKHKQSYVYCNRHRDMGAHANLFIFNFLFLIVILNFLSKTKVVMNME